MKRIILASLLATMASATYASGYSGTIRSVVCHTKNVSSLCQIRLNGTVNGDTCATNHWNYAFDGSTIEGKNLLSILLSAQVSQKTVVIGGTGRCDLALESEDLRHVYIDTPN